MELSLGKLTHLVWVRTFALFVSVRTFTCMVRELTLNSTDLTLNIKVNNRLG